MAADSTFDRRALLRGGLTVTAVGALSTVTPAVATAKRDSTDVPRIFETNEWAARQPTGPIEVQNHTPTYIVVHHTVEPGNSKDYSKDHAFQISRDIQDFHMDTRGWIDTGQQFTNSRGGFVTEGRHRSLEVLQGGTQHVQGSNVGNHNSEVLGIENEGLYTEVDVPQALWDSLVQLVAYVARQYSIQPEFIKGHRDFTSTECPGEVLYGRLPELRAEVAERLGVPARQPAEWPLLKPGDSGRRVLAAQHLLRARGARDVPTDGVFGPSTRDAVSRLARANGVPKHTCYAAAHADEAGFLGADIWPLIIRAVQPGTGGETARAAEVLATAAGRGAGSVVAVSTQGWKELLAAV